MGLLGDTGSGDRPLTLTELLDRATTALEQGSDLDEATASFMRYEVSRLYTAVLQTGKELQLLEQAAQGARRMGDDGLLAAAQCSAAWTQAYRDRTSAQRLLDDAELALSRQPRPPGFATLDCARARSRLLHASGDVGGAIREAQRALRAFDADPSAVVKHRRGLLATQLADVYRAAGRYREALALTEENLAQIRSSGRSGSISSAVAHSNLAANLMSLGEIVQAVEHYDEAIKLVGALPERAQPVGLRGNLAFALVRIGRPQQALALVEQDLLLAERSGNVDFQALGQMTAARALLMHGDVHEAARRRRLAEAVWQKDPRRYARHLREAALLEAETSLARGEPDVARTTVDKVLALLSYPQRRDGPGLDRALRIGAMAALRANDPGTGERLAGDAVAIARRIARDERRSADVGQAALLVAEAQLAQGRELEARQTASLARDALTHGLGAGHADTGRATRMSAEP